MTDRDYALMALAQRAVVADLERLGQHVSPRVLSGAVKDAGSFDGYATPADYREAVAEFIRERQQHATFDLP